MLKGRIEEIHGSFNKHTHAHKHLQVGGASDDGALALILTRYCYAHLVQHDTPLRTRTERVWKALKFRFVFQVLNLDVYGYGGGRCG